MTLSKPKCSIEGCGGWHKGHSYCSKHYQRFKKHGDPNIIKESSRRISLEEVQRRFWSRVIKTDLGCWEWQGHLDQDGYGQIKCFGKPRLAHRVVWYLMYGQWPELCILHSCDNRKCVNPDHLREGTPQDNVRDREERGRGYKGPKPWATRDAILQRRIQRERSESV